MIWWVGGVAVAFILWLLSGLRVCGREGEVSVVSSVGPFLRSSFTMGFWVGLDVDFSFFWEIIGFWIILNCIAC